MSYGDAIGGAIGTVMVLGAMGKLTQSPLVKKKKKTKRRRKKK